MIITSKFAIQTPPKCCTHVLSTMLTNAQFHILDQPFKVRGETVQSLPEKYKHDTFSSYPKQDLLKGKIRVSTFRRLPSFWLSYMWHQSLSTRIVDGGVQKAGIGETYSKEMKQLAGKQGHLFLPEIMAYSDYPDELIKDFVSVDIKYFLRQEKLLHDVVELFNPTRAQIVRLKEINNRVKTYSYGRQYPLSPRYWNPRTLKILYEHNTIWSRYEEKIYGNLLTKYS